VYGAEGTTPEETLAWVREYGEKLKPYICDTGEALREARERGKSILFEAQLGALRDLDQGIYPYTTSSSVLAAYAPVGAGISDLKLDEIIGVTKAYSTCVGEGPFVCEWEGREGDVLREAGGEYGATTGRPRRVGPMDLVATRYGVRLQGATAIALTKLDVLSDMEEIPVCTQYRVDGVLTDRFPFPAALEGAKPVLRWMEGWDCDISTVRRWDDLPQAARRYVERIEEGVGAPIRYISVGPERDSIILR